MSRKRNAAIVRKYSAALERLLFDSKRADLHDGLVEWWQNLGRERLGGPRSFKRVSASIREQLRAAATARSGKEQRHERHHTLIKLVDDAAQAAFLPDHIPDYETLADEMAELVLHPSGMEALPNIIIWVLFQVPPWAEIVHAVLTPKSWSVVTYDVAECTGDLSEIIRQKVGSEPIDFEQEMLLILSWEDRPGARFHYVLAPRRR